MFSVVVVFALLVAIGLAVDGGAQIKAFQRADAMAGEAARAAAQAVSFADPTGPTIDMGQACAAAATYLSTTEVELASCDPIDATTLQVNVVVTANTIFLTMIGQPTWEATGTAQARIAHGVDSEI